MIPSVGDSVHYVTHGPGPVCAPMHVSAVLASERHGNVDCPVVELAGGSVPVRWRDDPSGTLGDLSGTWHWPERVG